MNQQAVMEATFFMLKPVFGFDKTQHVFSYPALNIAVTTLHGNPSKLSKVVLIRRTCDKDYV